ncbi:hypothetical protein PG993_007007 [Apiospora rasikravindrae]|uniref:2EXR domain-containing protein n=1 Tax=Apiospora rasikravindrae TaxID=990691 RepID=A0ABR1SWB3_9PEZI
MSSFNCFQQLFPELRQMIWHEALNEEVESRMIIVHRSSMRVMPHKSTQSIVMNATRESRYYAKRLFFDVHLKVRNIHVNYDIAAEIMEYGNNVYGWRTGGGRKTLEMVRGEHGEPLRAWFASGFWRDHVLPKMGAYVTKLLDTAPQHMDRLGYGRSGKLTGTIFLSSRRDRFALTSTNKSVGMPWDLVNVEICTRAILRDQMYKGYCQAVEDSMRLNFNRANYDSGRPDNWKNEFWSRHMAGRLPPDVVRRIRRVVHLHSSTLEMGSWPHTCGEDSALHDGDWKLGSFTSAKELYTARLPVILNTADLGARNLLEWDKTAREDGTMSFTCMCNSGEGDEEDVERALDEILSKIH